MNVNYDFETQTDGGIGVTNYEPCIPQDFNFYQSTIQASYYFVDVLINDQEVNADDWVAGFNNDVCVGAFKWNVNNCNGGICSINLMGQDLYIIHI